MLTKEVLDLHDNDDFEEILAFEFDSRDVLHSKTKQLKRKSGLINAATLDSIKPTKAQITFKVEDTERKIISRVRGVGSQRVLVERGYSIPIHSIVQVEIISWVYFWL